MPTSLVPSSSWTVGGAGSGSPSVWATSKTVLIRAHEGRTSLIVVEVAEGVLGPVGTLVVVQKGGVRRGRDEHGVVLVADSPVRIAGVGQPRPPQVAGHRRGVAALDLPQEQPLPALPRRTPVADAGGVDPALGLPRLDLFNNGFAHVTPDSSPLQRPPTTLRASFFTPSRSRTPNRSVASGVRSSRGEERSVP